MSGPVVEMNAITKRFGDGPAAVTAVDSVDMTLERGEFVAIRGESGSGKSTLLQIAGCLDRPTSGTYRLDGEEVATLSDKDLARVRNREIGFVFQSFHLLSDRSALENVRLPLEYRRAGGLAPHEPQAMLERVGLAARTKHRPPELSGGERQRVAIARALVERPPLILCDEPTGNLDSRTGAEILDLLQSLREKENVSLLLVTHSAEVASRADRILTLEDGRDDRVNRRAALVLAFVLMATAAARITFGPAGPEVVVYTSLDPVFSRTVLERFERETGIRARAVFDTEATKTTGLVERVRRERENPICDVLWSNEPLRTIRLADEGCFESYEPAAAAGIPPAFRDAGHRWTGFAARARVVSFDPARIDPAEVPETLEGLLGERWRGRVAFADPRFGTTGSHLAALLALWGEPRYRAFLEGLVASDAQRVAGNSTSRDRVLSGEADLGLTDTDDVEVARRRGDSITDGFFAGEGTLVLPNTVAIVAGAPNPDAARALVEFLLDPALEEELAASPSRQIPVRAAVPVPESGLRLEDIPQLDISLEAAAKALPRALEIAREVLGL